MLGLLGLVAVAVAQDHAPRDVTVEMASRPWGTGVGVVLGKPLGLTVAHRPEHDRWLLQGVVGYNPVFRSGQVQADMLVNLWMIHIAQLPAAQLPVYVGGGVEVELGQYRSAGDQAGGFGLRAPFGIAYMDRDLPLDFFIEGAVVGGVAPSFLLDLDAVVGGRVYF